MKWDEAVNRLGEQQHGVAASRQLRGLGVDRNAERRRVTAGRWDRAAPGVIRIPGVPRTSEQILMTAVLSAGDDALASHLAAAWLWRLPGFHPTEDVLRARHGYVGETQHRPRLVLPSHRTAVRGIPCTTLPRTIFDLAGIRLPIGRLARLIDMVVSRSPSMLPALHRTLPELAERGREGIVVMRHLLDERPIGSAVPASGLERRFEQLCHKAGIRGLERQVDVGGHSWLGRVDYLRRDVGLIIEVDSVIHHTSVTDQANDAVRDEAMLAAGYRKVLRVTEEDIWYEPLLAVESVLDALRELGTAAA